MVYFWTTKSIEIQQAYIAHPIILYMSIETS